MKQTRLWARVWSVVTQVAVSLTLFAALPASAQDQPTFVELETPVTVNGITCRFRLEGPLPSDNQSEKYSRWGVMHPYRFKGEMSSYVTQSDHSVAKQEWYAEEQAKQFAAALEKGICAVVSGVNHINLGILRGRNLANRSTAYLNQAMDLEEGRQAIFVPLPGNVWAGMFAGEPGKSCNNFFALKYTPPKPAPKSVLKKAAEPALLPATIPRYLRHTGPVDRETQFIQGVVVGDDCEGDTYIPGLLQDIGDDVQGSGATRVDW